MINNSRGFTLIELLITIFILSALLFTGTFSYRMLANRWDKQLSHFEYSQAFTKQVSLLSSISKGIAPIIILDKTQTATNPAFFFVGFNNSLLSVTRSGLFSGKFPEIFRLTVQEQENGKLALIYQAVSTENILLITAQQEITFTHEVTLLNNIEQISFSYLGYDGVIARNEAMERLIEPTWRNQFSGIDNQQLPVKMEIVIKSEKKALTIQVPFDQKSLRYLTPYQDQQ